MTVDLKKYIEFVYGVTSAPSTDYTALVQRMTALEAEDYNAKEEKVKKSFEGFNF